MCVIIYGCIVIVVYNIEIFTNILYKPLGYIPRMQSQVRGLAIIDFIFW